MHGISTYRFGYGDIVCYPLSEKERRRWKFDTKNEFGFYLGDKKGMKGGCHVYQPYWHRIILTRGDVHRIRLSEFELMKWYGNRDKTDRGTARRRSQKTIISRAESYIEESYQEGETVWEENGELVRGINVLKQLSAHIETDDNDNDNEARIASQYRILTMHDPEILSVPEAGRYPPGTHSEHPMQNSSRSRLSKKSLISS
eukprot:gene33490-biopygen26512